MKIQVLGSGCATCKNLYKVVERVVKKINLNVKVEYSVDITEMVKFGVMHSPVFAIDGEALILKKVLKWQLLVTFFGVVTIGIIVIGYLFN